MIRIFSIILLFVSGCSDMSQRELELIGTWHWQKVVGDYEESGYLTLNKDRTNAYRMSNKNKTEEIVEVRDQVDGYWRMLESGVVCLATDWGGSPIWRKPEIRKENCYWEVEEREAQPKRLLLLKKGFTESEVFAERTYAH